MRPFLLPIILLFLIHTTARAEANVPAGLDATTTAFFQKHCVGCHGAKTAKADLRLDRLEADLDRDAVFDRWQKIVKQLTAGEMPPSDEKQPTAAERTAAIDFLHAKLDAASKRRQQSGRVVLRRLNRVEYQNTLNDLFAVDVDIQDLLPADAVANGFDNIGAALNVSPTLIERYLVAIDKVLDAAVARPAPSKKVELYNFPGGFKGMVKQRGVQDICQCKERRDTGEIVMFGNAAGTGLPVRPGAWADGIYRYRIECAADQSAVPVTMEILVGKAGRSLGFFDAHPKRHWVEFDVRLKGGGPWDGDMISIRPASLPKVHFVGNKDYSIFPGAGLAISDIECEGPLPLPWPTESYRRVYGDADPKTAGLADVEKILRALLPRAFRRPITDAELAPFVKVVEQLLKDGATFDQALRGGIKLVLCSPDFLYFTEQPGPLDDHALASRLSYFLWSTMPDDELLAVAKRGELKKPGVLRTQTERMLKDPRSRAFVTNFTGQWLSLREIDRTTPDSRLYPEFDPLLRWSMVEETRRFFTELLTANLSVNNFIDSDFTFLNRRLAKHYGIPGVDGLELRKVALKPEYHRGGILAQAAILKVTANGTTTSPVVRGVWVNDHFLGTPIPPPPPGVPAIEPDIRGATTVREQLAKHKQIATCAGCHVKIDPPGFALEEYDVIGGYRKNYRALTNKPVKNPTADEFPAIAKWINVMPYPCDRLGPAVDAGDVLADGRKFSDLAEYKKLLLTDPDRMARTVAEKLLIYATGGGLEYGDRDELERIVAESRAADYGLRSLVHEVVQSKLFLTK